EDDQPSFKNRPALSIGYSEYPLPPCLLRVSAWCVAFRQMRGSIKQLLDHIFSCRSAALPDAPDLPLGPDEAPILVRRSAGKHHGKGDPERDCFYDAREPI